MISHKTLSTDQRPLTTHYSLLTTHNSLLTTHNSQLTISHPSPMLICFLLSLILSPISGTSLSNPCDSIPALNKNIIGFVNSNLNKKVGRGECWDLAAQALNSHRAKWDGKYSYGTKVDYKSECVYPGDIIQFERAVAEYKIDGGMMRDEMPHHTAIIYEVKSAGDFILAHQNYNNKRKVLLTPLNMENIKRGKVMIYRPQG